MGIGTTEMLLIILVALILFGGSRIAGLGRGLGEGLRNFREAMRGEDPKPAKAEPSPAEPKKPA